MVSQLLPRTLRWQLALLTAGCLSVSILTYGTYMAAKETTLIHQKTQVQMVAVAQNLAAVSPGFLAVNDLAGLESAATRFAALDEIQSLLVTDTSGKPLAELINIEGRWSPNFNNATVTVPSNSAAIPQGSDTFWYPIEAGTLMGWVRISFQTPSFWHLAFDIWVQSLAVIALACAAALLLLHALLRSPLQALASVTTFAKNLDHSLGQTMTPYRGNMELQVLGHSLNAASLSLKFQQSELQNRQFALDQHAIVSMTDLAGNILYANDRFCDISHYARAELLGQDHRILNSGHHPAAMFDDLWQTICGGQVWHGEILNRNKDGGLYWTVTTVVPLMGSDGLPEQYISIRTDTTQRKQAEDAANAANRSKGQFLANMNHEIRTPMNGVIGMVDVLQQTTLLPEQRRMLGTIQQSSMALLQILNDILDFSKIEAGKLEVESIPTNLREVTEGVMQLMQAQATARSIELSVFVPPELPAWILCDPLRLRQVLLNLVGNALKFTHSTSSNPTASVRLRVEPCALAPGTPGVRLSVQDSGIGMSPEAVAKLFQPFTQADESTSRKFGGTGLGLSITQRLVELMGGHISVRSTPNEGSEFSVDLPLLTCGPGRMEATHLLPSYPPAQALPGVQVERRSPAQRPTAPTVEEAAQTKRLILLAEDHEINRDVMHEQLRILGYACEVAEDGAIALQMWQANPGRYALLMSDCHMPNLDGFGLTSAIRLAEAADAHLPIIAVTANAMQGEAERCRDQGMDGYLSKPLRMQELSVTLGKWMPVDVGAESGMLNATPTP